MQYLYRLENASLTLRLVEFLKKKPYLPIKFVTVIHQIDGWIVKIRLKCPLSPLQDGNLRAFLNELGIVYSPTQLISMALMSLETGQSAVDVMRCYQVAVVSHGRPQYEDIEAFRQHFINGLGYCPQNLT
jgi:hypothetical protein